MASNLIDHNPMFKKPALLILPLCSAPEGTSRAIVEEQAAAAWRATFRQTPAAVVDALVRAGYLREQVVVDGQPYAGTLESVYRDDAVALDAEVDALLNITAAGEQLLRDYDPASTLADLVAQHPAYAPVFGAMMDACAPAGGLDRGSLETLIEDALADGSISGAGGQRVYPQYFIDALETAGGIEWNGAWHATDAGRALRAS